MEQILPETQQADTEQDLVAAAEAAAAEAAAAEAVAALDQAAEAENEVEP